MARQWGRKDARVFKRKDTASNGVNNRGEGNGHDVGDREKDSSPSNKQLPMYNQNGQQVNHAGHQVTPGIQPDGESGRKWFSPLHFFRICWTSSCTASRYTNILWPFTIAALVLHFGFREHELWIFICAYIGMVPAANLVGFAGQEFARKMPKVAGVMIETTFGSIVEIILFTVLITKAYHTQQAGGEADTGVIRAAILGSILANMLLCLGKALSVAVVHEVG
jgi:Ca2+:H+ antiporter